MTTTYGRGWMGASAVVMATAVAGCGSAQANGAQGGNGEEFVRVINVEVMELRPSTFVEEIRLTAVATANQDVMVAAEESGVIREIFVDKGARVQQGQDIAKIDDSVLRAQVAQAQAQADLAAQTWERRKRLWEDDRVGSEIAYLEAKFAREQTAANLQGLQERLARTTIRAPFSGVLDERLVELGSMVGPSQAVARLVDLNPIKVVAGVPERYAADVRVGAAAQVSFDVLPGQVFDAPIRYVGAVVNPQNRTFPVEIVLPNARRLIKPEMVANVVVARRTVADATVVPQDALVRVQDGYVAFVVEQGSDGEVVASRPVRLGPTRRNLVVVESGVEVGESLVVVGQKSVAAGDRVNVVGTRVQGEG